MATSILCGRCGAPLANASAACPSCGAAPHATPYRARKSPITAALLATVLPGLGHIYLHQYKKGLFYLVAAGGLEFLGFDLDLTAVGAALGIPMGLGGFGLYLHGIYNAYQTAKQMEREGW